MECQYCGKQEALPFVCSYCGGVFCSDHRLPEAHKCTGDLSRRPVSEAPPSTVWSGAGYSEQRAPQPRSFSSTELRDIIVAWIALGTAFTVAITGGLLSGFSGRLSLVVDNQTVVLSIEITFILALFTIGVGFVLHELMHKFVSERYGFKAEFRAWPTGLGFALLSSLLAGLVFAAPGATYIMGYGIRNRENGIISLAGPLVNVAIALLFLPFLFVNFGDPTLFEAGFLGSYYNLYLAAFNMLPIFVLDGAKVWRWNKAIWAAVFVPLAAVIGAYLFGVLPII